MADPIKRKRKWVWLSPRWKHSFSVRAWSRSAESDWASVTLNLSDQPAFKWGWGAGIQARPIWWNRSIRVLWSAFPAKYRKWFDYYMLCRKSDSPPDAAAYADVAANFENSQYFLATVGDRKAWFLKTEPSGTIRRNYYFDYDIEKETVYYYWAYAVSKKGDLSEALGPNSAEWGKPQSPLILIDKFDTEVHDINKWTCDVYIEWDSGPVTHAPYGAEYYIIQHRQDGKLFWSLPSYYYHEASDDRYQHTVLRNLVVGKKYHFRIKAVNIPGIGHDALVSDWNADPVDWDLTDPLHPRNNGGWNQDATYTTLHDTEAPAEIENADVRRFKYLNVLRGDYAKLWWSPPNFAYLSEQLHHYNVYRYLGTDENAALYMAKINAHNPPVIGPYKNSTGGTGVDPYNDVGNMGGAAFRLGGTSFIDDDIKMTDPGIGPTYDISPFWLEDFETSGYRQTWNRREKVESGCFLNEDYPTAWVPGSPTTWGTQCLRVASDGDETRRAWVEHRFASSIPILYLEVDTILASITNLDHNGDYVEICSFRDNATHMMFRLSFAYDATASPSGMKFRLDCNPSGRSAKIYYTNFIISTGIKYKLAILWDTTNDTWYWKVDNATQASGTNLTSSYIPQYVILGINASTGDPIKPITIAYHVDNFNLYNAEPNITDTAAYYHYWITGVDVYGYESNVSMDTNKSYAKLSFSAPDVPEIFTHESNLTWLIPKKLYNFKVIWSQIDEAIWYQVKLRIKPPGTKYNGSEYDWSPWHYSAFIDEDRIERTDSDIYGLNLPSYTYPTPVQDGSLFQVYVRALNQAGPRGIDNGWSAVYESSIEGDTGRPGYPDVFLGECYGIKNLAAEKLWMGVILRWKPRPFGEGVQYYQIDYNDPVQGWIAGYATVNHHCLFNTNLPAYSLIRQYHTIMAPSNSTGQDTLQFKIRSIGYDENDISPDSPVLTVSWEAWWWL